MPSWPTKESTALGLVATSAHPLKAGVQIALLDLLLKAGAAVEGIPGGWQPLSAAIANGCPEAARFLAAIDTELYDRIVAGSPDPNWINSFLTEESRLKPALSRKQVEAALMWASEWGQNKAIEILLKNGVDQHSIEYTGLTALHWAAAGGQIETILLLLKQGASLEIENHYGGTVLNQALWWPFNGKPVANFIAVIETVLAAGAKVDTGAVAQLAKQDGLSAQEKAILGKMLRPYN